MNHATQHVNMPTTAEPTAVNEERGLLLCSLLQKQNIKVSNAPVSRTAWLQAGRERTGELGWIKRFIFFLLLSVLCNNTHVFILDSILFSGYNKKH